MSVAIIDYGSGNLHSAAKAFERAARSMENPQAIVVTRDPEVAYRADRIVLPGVGAFADCRRGLDAVDGMVEAITEARLERRRQAEDRIVDLNSGGSGREHDLVCRRDSPIVYDDTVDANTNRSRSAFGQCARIDDRHAPARDKPQLPISCANRAAIAEPPRGAGQSIRLIERAVR